MIKKIAIFGASVALFAASAIPAFAANSHASCMGFEASEISPPGSSNEFAGGMSELNEELKELANNLGIPVGALYGFIASLHEGSHAACDAVLG